MFQVLFFLWKLSTNYGCFMMWLCGNISSSSPASAGWEPFYDLRMTLCWVLAWFSLFSFLIFSYLHFKYWKLKIYILYTQMYKVQLYKLTFMSHGSLNITFPHLIFIFCFWIIDILKCICIFIQMLLIILCNTPKWY